MMFKILQSYSSKKEKKNLINCDNLQARIGDKMTNVAELYKCNFLVTLVRIH